jgi:hypothetical protein
MNPLFQQLNQNVTNVIQSVKAMNNPMGALQNLAQQNPQAKQIMSLLQNGANPQALCEQIAKQNGIDLNTILSMIK